MDLLPIQNNSNDNFATSSNSFSTLHYHQSHQIQQMPIPANTTNNLMNHLLSWRKSKRTKMFLRSATSYNNVCVIMKSEQNNCRTFVENQRQLNSMTECFHSHTSFSPVVSFINKGEGLISLQVMDRVMINDNELYSMGLAEHPISSINKNLISSTSLSNISNQTALQPPTPPLRNDSLYNNIEAQQWFHGSIHREKAIQMLENSPIGSFIVRYSTTKKSCYALSVRVPSDYQLSGIAHYLIVITPRNTFKIKGFNKEFESLNSLIIHHSIMREMLPCSLHLPINKENNVYASKTSPKCSLKQQNIGVIDENDNCEDVLVDVDSDPNYQKILTNFRKTMSHCS